MGERTPMERLAWKRRFAEDYQKRITPWSDIQAQMPLLYEAARRYEKPVVAELGTYIGRSTVALLRGASECGGHVWSVDNGPVTAPRWWEDSGFWSFLAADDMSEEAGVWVPAVLDVLFIDTSHLYAHTLAELRRYVPRVRPGGRVLCHDTELTRDGWPLQPQFPEYGGVMGEDWVRAAADGPEYPVAAALDDYCAETGLSWRRQPVPPGVTESEPFYGLGTILIP